MRDPMLFERSPERYRRARPPYPDQLWTLLAELGIARPGARVLDIGAGTGQATGPLVARGAAVDAIEPGEGLAGLLRRDWPTVDVEVATAETANYPRHRYDGVVCATALHWLDLQQVLPRIAASLRPGSPFVPFWHVFFDPDAPITPFRHSVNAMFGHPPTVSGTPLDHDLWTDRLNADGLLRVESVHEWSWEHQMTAAALEDLLQTFNGWSSVQIREAVATAERLGGVVTERYRTVAYVCRACAS